MRTLLCPLPIGCKGYILRDPYTDEETIVLNSRYSYEENRRTYMHEMLHHRHGDFNSALAAREVEELRHA